MSVLSLFLILLAPASALGAFGSGDKGTTSAAFLKIGAGARSAALGEAYSALADEASALYWNPGALAQIQNKSATLMHAPYFESIVFDYAAFAIGFKESGSLALGVQRLSFGSIDRTDENGIVTGNFSPSDLALSLGYGREVWGYSAGIAVKTIQSKIVNTASAQALDAGLLSPKYFSDRLRLAATLSNLGTQLKFRQESQDLPMALRLGGAYQITSAWLGSLDIGLPNDNQPYLAFGTEVRLPVGEAWTLAGRGGINTRSMNDLDGAGFALGFGVGYQPEGAKSPKVAFDYAFVPFGDLGSTQRLSVSLRF